MTTIDDSWVLITGASSGFGEEFVRQYAKQGHSLVLVALAEELCQQFRIDASLTDMRKRGRGKILHRELKGYGITVTALCPGLSDTGFATAAQMKITPVVRVAIRALQAGRISVVPGWANKAFVIFIWATPRWLHQAIFAHIMNV